MKVIPKSIWECYFYALWEATFNAFTYSLKGRSPEQRRLDIFHGKLAELKLAFENATEVEEGVQINSPKPDSGTDLKFKGLGNVQVKYEQHEKYVNDWLGYKKDQYPASDHVLLIQAFRSEGTSEYQKIKFFQQLPSKLEWKSSYKPNCKFYLAKDDFLEFTSPQDSLQRFGSFPKTAHPENDIDL